MKPQFSKILKKLFDFFLGKFIIDISDSYVNYLSYAIGSPGFTKGNLYCFNYAIRNLPSKSPIIEIGSFTGLSTNLITYYKEKHGVSNPLITCDKWEFEGVKKGSMVGKSSISHVKYRKFIKEIFIRNINFFSHNNLPYTIEMNSDDFFTAWRNSIEVQDVLDRSIKLGGPISFCYIDGNHSYDYVKRDFKNCDEFLEKGGFILVDDSEDWSKFKGILRVIKEIKSSKKYEVILKNPNHLFRKR